MSDAGLAEYVVEEAIRCKLPLNTVLGDEHEYASLPLCVIDAVFSIGVKYASTKLVPPRWAKAQSPQWPVHRRGAAIEHSISEFIEATERHSFDELATTIFANRQQTSSKNGILKAQAVILFAQALKSVGIERFTDCDNEAKLEQAEANVKDIKGQRSGISFDYFRLLVGHETVKADRMVCRFVARAASLDYVEPSVAKRAVIDATLILRRTVPNLSTRLLDYVIWNYESRNAALARNRPDNT